MDSDVHQALPSKRSVSLVMTVLNEAAGIADVLETLAGQTRLPDEVIVVDGGSTDGTVEVVRRLEKGSETSCLKSRQGAAHRRSLIPFSLRLIRVPGVNIARGRNIGIEAARGEIIVLTDAGCRLDRRWVERIVAPFEKDPATEFVAGFYKIDPHSLLEAVVGLATMRGALDPVDPATFNPSCRSMALTKELWERAGGFPEWLYTAEDTLFDQKVRRMRAEWRFAPEAVVYWRPRTTLSAVYRQFRAYAVGNAHIMEGSGDALYHARNLALVTGSLIGGFFCAPLWIAAGLGFAYFFIYAHHGTSRRISARLGNWQAYPLSLLVHWLLIAAGLDGRLRVLLRRRRERRRYREKLTDYLGRRAPGDASSPCRTALSPPLI